jgi:methyl-accepting chemotaxis protein
MFAAPGVKDSPEYRAFWQKLNRGEFDAGEYKRIGKGGKEVWIQASYNPIFDETGRPIKVVKFATDITEQKLRNANYEGQIAAIGKSQAIIEFNMDGTIIGANDNFLTTMGYTLTEIRGQHHSMFAPPGVKDSPEYRAFWQKLNRGEFDAAEYKRIGKGGKEIWIQASYNPIMDLNGRPCKVVKYATDVTSQKLQNANYAGQIAAISKSQAVIEFNMDGSIITANDNFLKTMGYSLSEIAGKHHSMFAAPGVKESKEYKLFWSQLNAGQYDSGEYKRIGKGGKEVWIQASYNPIMDLNGKPFKVVKYATDISDQKKLQMTIAAVLGETSDVMNSLAAGELSKSMVGKYDGEFARLAESVNGFIQRLRDIVTTIVQSSDTMQQSATEIAHGNADLSQRTEEQASSLEETASSMEEMTGTVKQNADNARQANSLASAARDQAEKGGEVVSRTVRAMDEINKSSKQIADIIGVIDEIAFQTNLLALNAAVEAARAGEQGRGFAVVAGEVRNLAQRSAGAAKEIKSLIKDSVSKVDEGSRFVNESGKTLAEIVVAVKKVSDIIAEIAAAGQEQSSGIEQVNKAIMQMDEMTQQNAALVEEAASASESMKNDAQNMYELMKFFKLG